MQAMPYMTCFWPGLPQLWWRGDLRALLAAVLFAAAVNAMLVVTFVWPEMLPSRLVTFGQLALAAIWMVSVVHSFRALRQIRQPVSATTDAWFCKAQGEYLQGHWFEAESLLKKVIRDQSRDVDAHLMLVGVYRQSGRQEEAVGALNRLKKFDGAAKWVLEIRREQQRLADMKTSSKAEAETTTEQTEDQNSTDLSNTDATDMLPTTTSESRL